MDLKCPICHKETEWEENPYRPFCSERCKLIDLGQWATEAYRVPGDKTLSETEEKEEKEDEGSDNGKKENR